ncbi:MAG: hypothetical protein DI566_11025 [Microbacterium sp.]|nr:MAG: hypothetical protein DI566_11025 [Microbacterium sp.]
MQLIERELKVITICVPLHLNHASRIIYDVYPQRDCNCRVDVDASRLSEPGDCPKNNSVNDDVAFCARGMQSNPNDSSTLINLR